MMSILKSRVPRNMEAMFSMHGVANVAGNPELSANFEKKAELLASAAEKDGSFPFKSISSDLRHIRASRAFAEAAYNAPEQEYVRRADLLYKAAEQATFADKKISTSGYENDTTSKFLFRQSAREFDFASHVAKDKGDYKKALELYDKKLDAEMKAGLKLKRSANKYLLEERAQIEKLLRK